MKEHKIDGEAHKCQEQNKKDTYGNKCSLVEETPAPLLLVKPLVLQYNRRVQRSTICIKIG